MFVEKGGTWRREERGEGIGGRGEVGFLCLHPSQSQTYWGRGSNRLLSSRRISRTVYLKSLVYKDRFKTLEDLRDNIRVKIDYILVDKLEDVANFFRNRLHQCMDNGG
ncbi:hypothetical protein TNCV_3402401 [Trichonephila clavipes]|nr:hypothetical protein TNCV_3402401 [Trichonephila clavipes]